MRVDIAIGRVIAIHARALAVLLAATTVVAAEDEPGRVSVGPSGAFDLSHETDRMHDVHGLHVALPEIDTTVTVSGFVQADFIHDFRQINSLAQFIPAQIVVPGGTLQRTTFSANPSRLIVGSGTGTAIGRLTTMFSMDLFGNATSRTPTPRLRQAWGQLDDVWLGGGFRAGQSWSTWDDVPALPETLDFWGPNGSDQTRHALLRWIQPLGEDWVVWLAIEDPSGTVIGGTPDTRSPDGVLSLTWSGDWGHVKPAVVLRDVGATSPSGAGRGFGWGVSASGLIGLPGLAHAQAHRDALRFQIQYGEGFGTYINDQVADAVIVGSVLQLLPVFAGYVSLQHYWLDRLRSNLTFGWVDVENALLEGPTARNRTFYVSGNIIFSPVRQVDLGFEMLWGERRDKNGIRGTALRPQVTAKFKF